MNPDVLDAFTGRALIANDLTVPMICLRFPVPSCGISPCQETAAKLQETAADSEDHEAATISCPLTSNRETPEITARELGAAMEGPALPCHSPFVS